MENFNRLVSKQMNTMDQLLFLQGELDRCQDIQRELENLERETELREIQLDINRMQKELDEIQKMFEKQTQDVINSYQSLQSPQCI